MSVANQANDKLTQLVSLTAKIESYLNPTKGKGKGQGAEAKGQAGGAGKTKNIIQEAMAVGGMAQSLAAFFKEYKKSRLGDGEQIKKLLVNMSDGIVQAAEKLKEVKEKEMLDKIGTVIKGVAGFTLTMVLVGLAAIPFAAGIIVFSLGVSAMNFIFSKLSKDSNATRDALGVLGTMGRGAALFSLAMILIGYAAQQFAIGVIVFTLAVSGMLLVFSLLGSRKVSKQVTDSMKVIFDMAKGAAFFALAMILIGITAPLFALGVIVFTLAVGGMILVFSLLNGVKKQVQESLKLIISMSKDIAIFALVMLGIGFFAPTFALGTIVFTLALTLIMGVLILLGKYDKPLLKATKALDQMAIPIAILGGVFLVVGLVWQPVAIGAVTMAGAIVVIGAATALVGMMDKNVKKGIKALDQLIIPVIAFAAAMLIIGLIPTDPLDLLLKVGVMALAITVLGLAAVVLGIPPIAGFAAAGAGVLVTLSLPMIIFAGALFVLSKASFTKESVINLGMAIGVIGLALAAMGFIAPFVIIGSAAMAVAAVALLPLSGALAIFKTIGWKKEDGLMLKNAVSSTVQAFAHALDGVGLMGMFKLLAAIPIVALLGLAMTSLAMGIKAMATMTFTEMEWDDKEKKLVAKKQVRLTSAEIQQVGPNVAAILNALADPLLEFGKKAAKGDGSWFGGGYMYQGLRAAQGIGGVISSLAKGVSDMAKLNVVDYEIKNGKLVPTSVRKLTPIDFLLAGINTSLILTVLARPLTEFGMYASLGLGIFGKNFMEKGIEVSSKIGGVISSLAKGVADMAKLNVVNYEVKNGKLVPKDVRKLDVKDFTNAGENVKKILQALVLPLTLFGAAASLGSGIFSGGYMEKGVKVLGDVSDPISKIAKLVTELAAGRTVVHELNDKGKLVPKNTISFADAIPKATEAIGKLLRALPQEFSNFGYYYMEHERNFEYANDGVGVIFDCVKEVAKIGEYFNKNKAGIQAGADLTKMLVPVTADMVKVVQNYGKMAAVVEKFQGDGGFLGMGAKKKVSIKPLFTDISEALIAISPGLQQLDQTKVVTFGHFTYFIEKLAKVVTPFERFAKAFTVFSKDMGVFVKNWKQFGDKDAKNFKVYGEVTEKIAKVDTGKLKGALDALIVYEKQKVEIERERAKMIKDLNLQGDGADPASFMEKLSNTISSFLGGGNPDPGTGGGDGPITTPKIQVNGNIIVTGNIDKA